MNLLMKKFGVTIVILAAGLLMAACGAEKEPVAEEEAVPAVLVEAAPVTRADISEVSTVNGKLAAKVEVSVVPKMAGRISEVNFQVGDTVKKGDVLVRIAATELQAQLNQAQAVLNTAQAAHADAKTNLARMKTLYAQGAVSKQQLEMAESGVTASSPDAAAATVQMIQAQLANTVVTSPLDGLVASRTAEVGGIAGQGPVMVIVDLDTVVVHTDVTEGEVNKLSKGQEVDVLVSAVSADPFLGRVTAISPAADSRSSAFPVQISIDNPDHILKSGMFAEIRLVLSTKKGVLVVPKAAVVDSGDGRYVFLVKDGLALQTTITTGVEDETRVEVITGLQAGDSVVVSGQNKLQDKSAVTVSGGTE